MLMDMMARRINRYGEGSEMNKQTHKAGQLGDGVIRCRSQYVGSSHCGSSHWELFIEKFKPVSGECIQRESRYRLREQCACLQTQHGLKQCCATDQNTLLQPVSH